MTKKKPKPNLKLEELRAFWARYKGRTWSGFGITFTEPLTIFQPDIARARKYQRESIVSSAKHRHKWIRLPVSVAIRQGRYGKLLGFFNKVCIVCGKGE